MRAGLKPKKSLSPAFGCFSFFLLFFFSKRSYFLQWFYTEGKTQAKKKKCLYLNPKSFPFPCICLKTKGLLVGAQGKDRFCRVRFLSCCLGFALIPGPCDMVPERQAWSSLYRPPPNSWPSAMPAAKKRGAERMTEGSSPSWLTTLGRGSCLPYLPPAFPSWGRVGSQRQICHACFFYIVFRQEMGKKGGEGKSSLSHLSLTYKPAGGLCPAGGGRY